MPLILPSQHPFPDPALHIVAGADPVERIVALRAGGETRPIIAVIPQEDWKSRVAALHAGADDVVDPAVNQQELTARKEALLRRCGEQQGVLSCGELCLDLVARRAQRGCCRLDLLAREFALLAHFVRNSGRLLSRADLLRAVWKLDFDPGTNSVQVHVSRLRAKLDRGFAWPMLRTVRGRGYVLLPEGEGMAAAAPSC